MSGNRTLTALSPENSYASWANYNFFPLLGISNYYSSSDSYFFVFLYKFAINICVPKIYILVFLISFFKFLKDF